METVARHLKTSATTKAEYVTQGGDTSWITTGKALLEQPGFTLSWTRYPLIVRLGLFKLQEQKQL